ncbi:hypothetical protein SAMN02983003_1061 [Devosia enhydra]|uniref:Uncharacterized protein n=1 Tax=Devosia enhydra TaxID=665118 RepID=A0A1K2HWI3_9HYPH|nr:hypothetical protein [Devosia enhydra]SFZ82408.1 hypothetical protein SAMN02983003_1061 [Devosia enhydra]
MQLSDVTGNAIDQDKGRAIELVDPFTGEATGLRLWLVGPDSDTARRARLALTDELTALADADGRVSAEHREAARLNCLAKHVQRWDVQEAGHPVPFTTGNLLTLLRVHWVQAQVDAFAGDRRNFAPGA